MRDELIVKSKPKSNISEDIRTIRTNLQFTASDDDVNLILITSSIPGEGKSFISSNLAVAFAQTGKKTLLIDSDLRLGRIHKIFKVSNESGFSNLLIQRDKIDITDYVVRTDIPDLYIIPRGTVPQNPSELLESKKTKKMLEFFREKFDYVIFDGTPVNGLPDALVLSGMVDRTILVASVGNGTIDELNEAKKSLQKVGANIAGVVLNRTEPKKRGKYYGYYE